MCRIQQIFKWRSYKTTNTDHCAEAIVLSILPGNKIQLHVFPKNRRNFVTEIKQNSIDHSQFRPGVHVLVKYHPDKPGGAELVLT